MLRYASESEMKFGGFVPCRYLNPDKRLESSALLVKFRGWEKTSSNSKIN